MVPQASMNLVTAKPCVTHKMDPQQNQTINNTKHKKAYPCPLHKKTTWVLCLDRRCAGWTYNAFVLINT